MPMFIPSLLLLFFAASCQPVSIFLTPSPPQELEGKVTETDAELPSNQPSLTPFATIVLPESDSSPIVAVPTRDKSRCPQLDSVLWQLYTADDPDSFAQQHTLLLTTDGVGVEIQLIQADAELNLNDYQGVARSQRGPLLEAFVPLTQLCKLSQAEQVLRIRPLRFPDIENQ